ncbi:MAG: response regulator, partial [Candidatus Hydrothermarchaeales archaeon]
MPRIKVLLADDDAQIQRDVSEILSDEGYEVSTVGSGEEALEVIDRVSHFDLIITDLMMPGMDGLELLKRIKEIEPSSTVIIFTAHATMERAIDAMRHGASDFVVKPYKIEEFIATINRYKETIELKRLKDLFMDIMRHDLLNPAGIARNMAEMVLDDEKDSNKREALKTILRSSERIIEMIENASTLAKLESREKLEFKDRDLGEILRSVSAEMTHLADEKNM